MSLDLPCACCSHLLTQRSPFCSFVSFPNLPPRFVIVPFPLILRLGGEDQVNPGATAVATSQHLIAGRVEMGLTIHVAAQGLVGGPGPPQTSGPTMSAGAGSQATLALTFLGPLDHLSALAPHTFLPA